MPPKPPEEAEMPERRKKMQYITKTSRRKTHQTYLDMPDQSWQKKMNLMSELPVPIEKVSAEKAVKDKQ